MDAVRIVTSSNGARKLALCFPGVKEGRGEGLRVSWSSAGVSAKIVVGGVGESSIAGRKGSSG